VDALVRHIPKLNYLDRSETEEFLRIARDGPCAYRSEVPPNGQQVEKDISSAVEAVARAIDAVLLRRGEVQEFGWFNAHLVRRFGKPRKSMGPDELKEVLAYADAYLKRLQFGGDFSPDEVPEVMS
jgi:hypothetical protein